MPTTEFVITQTGRSIDHREQSSSQKISTHSSVHTSSIPSPKSTQATRSPCTNGMTTKCTCGLTIWGKRTPSWKHFWPSADGITKVEQRVHFRVWWALQLIGRSSLILLSGEQNKHCISNLLYYHFVGHCGAFYGLKWRLWQTNFIELFLSVIYNFENSNAMILSFLTSSAWTHDVLWIFIEGK